MQASFVSHIDIPDPLTQKAKWFVFQNDEILLFQTENNYQIPTILTLDHFNFDIVQQHYMGAYQGEHCFALQVKSSNALPSHFAFLPIRHSYELLQDNSLFEVVIRAKQLLHWDKSTQFCGHCGQKNGLCKLERAKECPACKAMTYPQIAPVMLVLIWRGDEILLGRSAHFMPGVYSLLAGFTEPGETLETTVEREVYEEVGLSIKNLKYFGSQPWPFPSNLMLGFTAEYAGGELVVDKKELEDAKWFSLKQLPPLPKPLSLSRKIIDAYLAMHS